MLSVALFLGIVAPVFSTLNMFNTVWWPGTSSGLGLAVWAWTIPPQSRYGVSAPTCTFQLLTGLTVVLTMVSFSLGGVASPSIAWVALGPALGLAMTGTQMAVRSAVVSTLAIVVLGILTGLEWVYPMDLPPVEAALLFTFNALCLAFVLAGVGRAAMQVSDTAKDALEQANAVLNEEVSEHEATRHRLRRTHQNLVDAAHVAGAAQLATGILHNLGNALNAVQVASGLAESRLSSMRLGQVGAVADLVQPHVDAKIARYTHMLATELEGSRTEVRDELRSLRQAVEHAAAIVSTQQRHAVRTSVTERVAVSELLADAVALCSRVDTSVRVNVLCPDLPLVVVDRHRLLQIITNLIANAYDALVETTQGRITVEAKASENAELLISIHDNGVGIDADNLERIFTHGFTTRDDGHGFGLHASALAARELGGTLTTSSPGLNMGASFTVTIPSPWDEDESELATIVGSSRR